MLEESLTATKAQSTTQFEPLYNESVDIFIAILLICCFIAGSVLNIVTTIYFSGLVSRDIGKVSARSSKKLLYNGLYLLNSVNDFLICFTILPVAVSFLRERGRAWFSNHVFCSMWGTLWEVLPYLSIMYVMMLSLTRTYHLLFPLKRIKKRVVGGIILSYTGLCVGRSVIPAVSKLGTYTFHQDSVYCFEWARLRYPAYVIFAEYSDVIQLAVPILPILVGCSVSMVLVYCDRTRNSSTRTSQLQRQASNTVILFTLLYIVLNVPVVMLCVLYTKVFVNNLVYNTVFNNQFLYWYSWSCVYILGVALNANFNPLLYIWRMQGFRTFVVNLGKEPSSALKVWKSTTFTNKIAATTGGNENGASASQDRESV